MKIVLASTLLLCSSFTFAHDDNNSCDVDIHGGMKITQQDISFFKQAVTETSSDQSSLYTIHNDQQLYVHGKQVDLTSKQQELVSNYAHHIRTMVPKVKQVANEGIDLAIEGVSVAFNELLGNDNDVSNELVLELTKVKNQVNERFDENKPLYINEKGINGDDVFDEEFERHIESTVETAVKKSIGSVLIAVGREMMFSDGDAFEQKMEKFGDKMEATMEVKANKIEQKVSGLCLSMKKIDQLEEALKDNISQLPDFNVLSVEQHEKSREQAE